MANNSPKTTVNEATLPFSCKKKGYFKKITPYFLITVFFAPLFLAYFLFLHTDDLDIKTTEKGFLLRPPIALTDFSFQTDNQITLPLTAFKGRWLLLFMGPCNNFCANTLYNMSHIRQALGKKSLKISNLFISIVGDPENASQEMQSQYETISFGTIHRSALHALSDSLPVALLPLQEGKLYLIDPQGYLIMGYAMDADPNALLKDLKKLVQG